METLLQKSKINITRLQRVLLKILSTDVNNLSRPCYEPPLKITLEALFRVTGLNEKDIKEFMKRTYKGTIAEKFLTVNRVDSNLLLFIMWYALRKRNKTLFHSTLTYHMVRQYAHVMKRQFPQFCNAEVFSYALETLTKTHLFSREKTISNTLFHLARELQKQYTRDIQTFNIDAIIKFLQGSRHRISQSVKSFSEHYYRAWKGGDSIKTHQDALGSDEGGQQYQAQQLERGKKVIDVAVKKLTVYKTTDADAMREAVRISKIKFAIADIITKQLKDVRYADGIRLILQLFIKKITTTDMLCGKGYELYVKKLMGLKRTGDRIYFKQQINILLMKLLKDAGYTKTFLSYTRQTQLIINSYLAFYLTMVLRNSIC